MTHRLDISEAARVLYQHRQAATKLAALPPDLRPRDRAEGYAIQAALASYSPHPVFGWKIAATSEAGQKHINVAGPMAGRILAETVLPNGGTASMRGNVMWVAEPEFAFRMGRDLPPRSDPYSVAEVLAAVDTLHPAIEVPDSRFADFVNAGKAQLIANNACANLFVFGSPAPND
jgi:2-keto-4-pentenoate hydratase